MSLKDWFKKKAKKQNNLTIADYINGYYPSYSQFGSDIYASDVVQQAIFSIVNELKKLDPVHIRKSKGLDVQVSGNIQSVLDNPNPLMTTSDFIEKMAWNLLLNYNSFAYPMWDGDTLKAIYPLQPSYVEFKQDLANEIYVSFRFPNNVEATVPYSYVIHIRYKYSVSEFMGGDIEGQPDNKPLLETLNLNDTLLKGLAKSLKMQTSVQGILSMKTMVNSDAQIAMVKDFEKKLNASASGILTTDINNTFTPISKSAQLIDKNTLEFIDKKIFRWFGTSIAIVDGDYTPAQYNSFYQKTLEPIIKSFNEAFTKGLFSRRETGFNNKIKFYTNELQFMNNDQKLQLFTLLSNQGGVFINEIRTSFGLRPDPELDGVRCQSLNFVNANKADEYQGVADTQQTGGDNQDE